MNIGSLGLSYWDLRSRGQPDIYSQSIVIVTVGYDLTSAPDALAPLGPMLASKPALARGDSVAI